MRILKFTIRFRLKVHKNILLQLLPGLQSDHDDKVIDDTFAFEDNQKQ